MTTRIPTMDEARDLAAALEASGYPIAEAAANFRSAFKRDPENVDGALMFEGEGVAAAEATADQWSGLSDDDRETELNSWLNETLFCALLVLAAKAGEPGALEVAETSLRYCREDWSAR